MNLKRVLIAVAVSIPTIAIGERSYRAFKNVAESEKNDPNFRPTKPSKVVADDPSTSLPVPKPPKEFATSRKSSSSDNSIVNDSPSPSSSSSISQHVAFQLGAPTLPTSLVVNEAFVTAFDRRTRTACWSCEHLTRARMAATARGESNGSSSGGGGAGSNDEITREKSSFYEPTSEPEQFRPLNSDYMKSGFDRGHLVPAANFKWSQQAMNETFSLTNIAPQVGVGFNRDYWARFESFVRKLDRKYDDVYICTGPAFVPKQQADGKFYVTYQVIGSPPNVAVPTHFYKIVVATRSDRRSVIDGSDETSLSNDASRPTSTTPTMTKSEPVRVIATASFLMPNEAIDENAPLESFLIEQASLERLVGVKFFDQVYRQPNTKVVPLCQDQKCVLPEPGWWEKDKSKSMK